MRFCSLASGSSGNSQYIETDQARILVDGGLSGSAIQKNLEAIGVDPASLDAIFVTHEHIDHVKGVGVLARRFGLEVFANENTWLAMEKTVKKIPQGQIRVFDQDLPLTYKGLEVTPLRTFHDCVQGTAYVFEEGGKKISLLTDTGRVSPKILEAMEGSQVYYIEANHDPDLLRTGPYPRALKARISSQFGHLSNDHAAQVLARLLRREGEEVILGHLSGENNRPRLAARAIREGLAQSQVLEGLDFRLEVAPALAPSSVIEI